MNYLSEFYICLKISLSAVIGGVTVLIIYFTSDSCGPDSCPEYKKCKSLNGFDFECEVIQLQCDGITCCEDSPNPLCCLNGGFCSNDNFIFNGTNSDKCQCECIDGFEGDRCEIDNCQGLICKNGSCESGSCTCDAGYVNIENNCEETCALNPCQELIQIGCSLLTIF